MTSEQWPRTAAWARKLGEIAGTKHAAGADWPGNPWSMESDSATERRMATAWWQGFDSIPYVGATPGAVPTELPPSTSRF